MRANCGSAGLFACSGEGSGEASAARYVGGNVLAVTITALYCASQAGLATAVQTPALTLFVIHRSTTKRSFETRNQRSIRLPGHSASTASALAAVMLCRRALSEASPHFARNTSSVDCASNAPAGDALYSSV